MSAQGQGPWSGSSLFQTPRNERWRQQHEQAQAAAAAAQQEESESSSESNEESDGWDEKGLEELVEERFGLAAAGARIAEVKPQGNTEQVRFSTCFCVAHWVIGKVCPTFIGIMKIWCPHEMLAHPSLCDASLSHRRR